MYCFNLCFAYYYIYFFFFLFDNILQYFFYIFYSTVIETLKTVDTERKCFRLIGGVLCERTVKDVLPQLIDTSAQLQKHITILNEQLVQKGKEINKYREDHNIKIRGQQDSVADKTEANDDDSRGNRNHILVAN